MTGSVVAGAASAGGAVVLSAGGASPPQAARTRAATMASGASKVFDMGSPWGEPLIDLGLTTAPANRRFEAKMGPPDSRLFSSAVP